MSLILSKLLGPTSTLRTLMLLLLYVRRKAMLLRILPGDISPGRSGTVNELSSINADPPKLIALALLCAPMPLGLGGANASSSAVVGRLSPLFFLPLLNNPCALGALATRRSFRASSSFPDADKVSFPSP
jgi:hypothetical protein